MRATGRRAQAAERRALQSAGDFPTLFNSFSQGAHRLGDVATPACGIVSLDTTDMQCILLQRRVLSVWYAQAEHERVQGRLFDLHESQDIASHSAAAASELTLQQKEALAQQVR